MLDLQNRAITMVNPCTNCEQGELLSAASKGFEGLFANLNIQSSSLWDTTLELTEQAAAVQDPESGESPATRADIDQKQEHVLDTTSRITRVSGEIVALFSSAMASAAEIDCDSIRSEANGHCPRLLELLSINPQVQELIQEV